MERHYSLLCSEVQPWITEIGHQDYSSRKAGLKKEIPLSTCGLEYNDVQTCAHASQPIEVPTLCGAVFDSVGAVIASVVSSK